jgi:hypothetical protein
MLARFGAKEPIISSTAHVGEDFAVMIGMHFCRDKVVVWWLVQSGGRHPECVMHIHLRRRPHHGLRNFELPNNIPKNIISIQHLPELWEVRIDLHPPSVRVIVKVVIPTRRLLLDRQHPLLHKIFFATPLEPTPHPHPLRWHPELVGRVLLNATNTPPQTPAQLPHVVESDGRLLGGNPLDGRCVDDDPIVAPCGARHRRRAGRHDGGGAEERGWVGCGW